MSLLSFLFNKEPKSASTAKERLQIIIARERGGRSGPDFLPALHRELIEVISKYTKVDADDIKISLDRQGNLRELADGEGSGVCHLEAPAGSERFALVDRGLQVTPAALKMHGTGRLARAARIN